MANFEDLYKEQTKDLDFFRVQYKVTDNWLDRFVEQNGRYPTEEECAQYYERLQRRLAKKEEKYGKYN